MPRSGDGVYAQQSALEIIVVPVALRVHRSG
jgi:hypothetical protein